MKFYIITVPGYSFKASILRQKMWRILFSWEAKEKLQIAFPGTSEIEHWGNYSPPEAFYPDEFDLPASSNNKWLFFGDPDGDDLTLWQCAGVETEIVTLADPRLKAFAPGRLLSLWWLVSEAALSILADIRGQ